MRFVKHVPPSIRVFAFNCPHCQAFAHQAWFTLRAKKLDGVPFEIPRTDVDRADRDPTQAGLRGHYAEDPVEETSRLNTKERARMLEDGTPLFWRAEAATPSHFPYLRNVFVSKCPHCELLSVWIFDRLGYPQTGGAPPANPDLPDNIRRDYDEASSILDKSPRGAAALIRLAIQKLCDELGQSGKNLNDAIKGFAKQGLDSRVRKALDTVRVVGNHAVHPGQMDLKDDRETAESLFGLLNTIADRLISAPKQIDAIYEKLPDDERKRIEKRDAGK